MYSFRGAKVRWVSELFVPGHGPRPGHIVNMLYVECFGRIAALKT